MELYLDSADIQQIEQATKLGILDGVTTNPTLIAKEGRDFETVIREISEVVDGKIWAEVIGTESDTMIEEALRINGWAQNMVVKLPMGTEGLKAARTLSSKGLQTNMTLVYSVSQAILAAKASVSYVSPYAGRVDDVGWSGEEFIGGIASVFATQRLETRVLAASVRSPQQVVALAKSGVDGVTVPYEVLIKMAHHPMTEVGLTQFLKDWDEAKLGWKEAKEVKA